MNVWESFQDNMFVFATKKRPKITIPIARVDVSKKYGLFESEGLNVANVPKVLVYYDGTYYPFTMNNDPKLLYHFINRLLHPLITLKTQETIETFLDVEKEHKEVTRFMLPPKGLERNDYLDLDEQYMDKKFKTRVICMVYNKGDYDEELEEIRKVARKSAASLHIRIALVSDPRLIK